MRLARDVRDISLDGVWEFVHLEKDGPPDWTRARPIQVPVPWQAPHGATSTCAERAAKPEVIVQMCRS